MNACACMGPPGDCYCIRAAKGLPQKITETNISADVFDLLDDADKNLINSIKHRAFDLWWASKDKTNAPHTTQE